MDISQIKSLLNEINQYDQGKEKFSLIEKAEKVLIEYLTKNPSELEMRYNLVLLNLVLLYDEFGAIKHLQEIWYKFHDERAAILIAFIKEQFLGGIEQNDFKILSLITPTDVRLKACTEKLISDYCMKNKSEADYLKHLQKSISLYDKYVNAYLYLGYFYKEQKADDKSALNYFSKAISCVEKVFNDDDIRSMNYFDLEGYFDEMIYGVHCTIPKYEYLKSLAEGKGN